MCVTVRGPNPQLHISVEVRIGGFPVVVPDPDPNSVKVHTRERSVHDIVLWVRRLAGHVRERELRPIHTGPLMPFYQVPTTESQPLDRL